MNANHCPAMIPLVGLDLCASAKSGSPFDPLQVPAGLSLLFDATVYIDQLKGQLRTSIVNLMAFRTILHGAPALAEISVTIGALDPANRRTQATLIPIIEMLTRINPSRIIAPSYEAWLEGSDDRGNFEAHAGYSKARSPQISQRCPTVSGGS